MTLPQLVKETGLSQDYTNQYGRFGSFYNMKKRRLGAEAAEKMLIERLKEEPIKTYEGWFHKEREEIDWSNPRIKLLNQITMYVNIRTLEKRLSADMFMKISNEVHAMVKGTYQDYRT